MPYKKHFFPTLVSVLTGMLVGLSFFLLKLTYAGRVFQASIPWFQLQTADRPIALSAGIYVDFTAAIMLCLVSSVSFLVCLYSVAYMQQQADRQRYFALLSFFIVAMIGLVLVDNLVLLLMTWELVGFAAYLFVGFWYQNTTAAKASTRIWLINQLGSMSLFTGILILGTELGTFHIATLVKLAASVHNGHGWLSLASLLLIGGAITKSAQFPLFYWLSSAMVAPSPASALIHAATLVSTGAYLLIRIVGLLSPMMCTLVAFIGSLTTFMGSCTALTQYDIKKALAYATTSQLGYVIMAIGVGKSDAGLFHLVTHGFSKACLFLCVGAIIQFLLRQGQKESEAQDMRLMGGLRRALPWVFYPYLMAAAALMGIPGWSGFLSKEAILTYSMDWAQQQLQAGNCLSYAVPVLGFLSSCLTVVYIGRQCYWMFIGTPRWGSKASSKIVTKGRPIPYLMRLSVVILALCSLGFFYSPTPWDFSHSWLLQQDSTALLLGTTKTLQQTTALIAIMTTALGLALLVLGQWLRKIAWLLLRYIDRLSLHSWLDIATDTTAQQVLGLSRLVAKLDQRFATGCTCIATGYTVLASAVHWLDRKMLEGTVSFIAALPRQLGRLHRLTQQGNLQHYLLWTFIGLGLLLIIGYLFG